MLPSLKKLSKFRKPVSFWFCGAHQWACRALSRGLTRVRMDTLEWCLSLFQKSLERLRGCWQVALEGEWGALLLPLAWPSVLDFLGQRLHEYSFGLVWATWGVRELGRNNLKSHVRGIHLEDREGQHWEGFWETKDWVRRDPWRTRIHHWGGIPLRNPAGVGKRKD